MAKCGPFIGSVSLTWWWAQPLVLFHREHQAWAGVPSLQDRLAFQQQVGHALDLAVIGLLEAQQKPVLAPGPRPLWLC